jgi:hypothetical protein
MEPGVIGLGRMGANIVRRLERAGHTGELPGSGPVLGVIYRLLARPAIERVVGAHLADLARRAASGRSPALAEDAPGPAPVRMHGSRSGD